MSKVPSPKEFMNSLTKQEPATNLSAPLLALWYDCKENWEKAHEIAQANEGSECDLIHAYLHRKEGDISNARYWYFQAKSSMANCSLEEERELLIKKFCK